MPGHVPALFMREHPVFADAFFGGPMLPMSYNAELHQYQRSLEYPLQILEIPARRRAVAAELERIAAPVQGRLFVNADTLFDDLLLAKGRPLYMQWQQQVGEKTRYLSKPRKALDALLRSYVLDLVKQMPVHAASHGGEEGWSPAKSIATHQPMRSAFTFDMKDAFRNVTIQYVFDAYYRFLQDRTPAAIDLAGFLSHLCTVRYGRHEDAALPQGSPVSGRLFNRVMEPVDRVLDKECRKRGMRYSRWVDDFIISSPKCKRVEDMAGAVSVMRDDFPISAHKVFFQRGPPLYLLGHKVDGQSIALADAPVRTPVEPWMYQNRWELDHPDFYDEEYMEIERALERETALQGNADLDAVF